MTAPGDRGRSTRRGTGIHLFGASGSGTTTLGARLADRMGGVHLDTDDYYWLRSDPPYVHKRPIPERIQQIETDIPRTAPWVLSGSLCSWGDPLLHRFDLAVLLRLDPEIRLRRLFRREQQRYRHRIEPGGDMVEQHEAFMAWARTYDTARAPERSLDLHQQWMRTLSCPVLVLDSAHPTDQLAEAVLDSL